MILQMDPGSNPAQGKLAATFFDLKMMAAVFPVIKGQGLFCLDLQIAVLAVLAVSFGL